MHALQLQRRFDYGIDRDARPFEEPGVAMRIAPFLGLLLTALAFVPVAYHGGATQVLLSLALVGAVVAAIFLVPWARLPAGFQAVPMLLLYVVAALVRDATGGGDSVFTAVVLLPVVWFALYGTRNQVLFSIVGCAL